MALGSGARCSVSLFACWRRGRWGGVDPRDPPQAQGTTPCPAAVARGRLPPVRTSPVAGRNLGPEVPPDAPVPVPWASARVRRSSLQARPSRLVGAVRSVSPAWAAAGSRLRRCVSAGLRRLGSAALDLAGVAAGRYDVYWERSLQPWDIAAGIVLVREAGGYVSDADGGTDMLGSGSVIAGNEIMHRELLALLKNAA